MKEGSTMMSKMKNKLKAGNTLSFVLILLIVVSIISMALVYSISYTTRTRLNKSHDNYEIIILQNNGYEVLNLYIKDLEDNSSLTIKNFSDNFTIKHSDFLEKSEYKIEFEDVNDSNSIRFKIGKTNDDDALLVEAKYEYNESKKITGYKLKKWGMTKWT